MARIAAPVTLNKEQGEALVALELCTMAQGLARRAGIVLACADGLEDKQMAQRLGAHQETVARGRKRFIAHGTDGLYDAARPARSLMRRSRR